MRKKFGFTLVEIMIVVAIIGLLAAIAVPAFMKARKSARETACMNNLRMIRDAKQQWALAYGGNEDDLPTLSNISEYIEDTNDLFCPAAPVAERTFGGSYSMHVLQDDPTCGIVTDGSHEI